MASTAAALAERPVSATAVASAISGAQEGARVIDGTALAKYELYHPPDKFTF